MLNRYNTKQNIQPSIMLVRKIDAKSHKNNSNCSFFPAIAPSNIDDILSSISFPFLPQL